MILSSDKQEKLNEVLVSIISLLGPRELANHLSLLSEQKASTSVIFEFILGGALGLLASDIHFEPSRDLVKIRIRIDGVLQEAGALSQEEYKYIISRIKLLGSIKFNITGVAQGGRFTIINRENNKNIAVRVSLNPSEHGVSAVFRILDPEAVIIEVQALGLRSDHIITINEVLKKPNGMILVTGPTGSGKTTTLYSFLNRVNNPNIKIITIEDPVEYHLSGIQQTQVDTATGYSFGQGLRSILRQDPDIILIGEIRDAETANIAIQASLTGHVVFSTLHTNTAAGAIPRLLDLEVESHAIGPAINMILAQRLVRKLCVKCRQKIEIDQEYKEKIQQFIHILLPKIALDTEDVILYKPVGCSHCIGGYKGRVGIFEIFKIDKEIEILTHNKTSEAEIEKYIFSQGFVNMQQDGIIKALQGITSLEEIEKATGSLVW